MLLNKKELGSNHFKHDVYDVGKLYNVSNPPYVEN